MQKHTYSLIDSGNGQKLERFGPYVIARPAAQAVWRPTLTENEWQKADVIFTRENENRWLEKKPLPESWKIDVAGITFKLASTDFGHLGIFPEQRPFWEWIQKTIQTAKSKRKEPVKVLNLFAYSGGSTLAAAKVGAEVCHLDASKGMVAWARENAVLNKLEEAPIRWIVDDVNKFLAREIRRESRYDAIILDPPSFGRGARGEVFKIEGDIQQILSNCRALLTPNPLFIIFSCHTPGFTPLALRHLLSQTMQGLGGTLDEGEMTLTGENEPLPLPSGAYARWHNAL